MLNKSLNHTRGIIFGTIDILKIMGNIILDLSSRMDMCVFQIKSLNGDAFNSTTRCTLLQYNNGCLIPEGGLRGIRMIRDVMDVNYMLNVIFLMILLT